MKEIDNFDHLQKIIEGRFEETSDLPKEVLGKSSQEKKEISQQVVKKGFESTLKAISNDIYEYFYPKKTQEKESLLRFLKRKIKKKESRKSLLEGEWGVGKTTCIYTLKEQLGYQFKTIILDITNSIDGESVLRTLLIDVKKAMSFKQKLRYSLYKFFKWLFPYNIFILGVIVYCIWVSLIPTDKLNQGLFVGVLPVLLGYLFAKKALQKPLEREIREDLGMLARQNNIVIIIEELDRLSTTDFENVYNHLKTFDGIKNLYMIYTWDANIMKILVGHMYSHLEQDHQVFQFKEVSSHPVPLRIKGESDKELSQEAILLKNREILYHEFKIKLISGITLPMVNNFAMLIEIFKSLEVENPQEKLLVMWVAQKVLPLFNEIIDQEDANAVKKKNFIDFSLRNQKHCIKDSFVSFFNILYRSYPIKDWFNKNQAKKYVIENGALKIKDHFSDYNSDRYGLINKMIISIIEPNNKEDINKLISKALEDGDGDTIIIEYFFDRPVYSFVTDTLITYHNYFAFLLEYKLNQKAIDKEQFKTIIKNFLLFYNHCFSNPHFKRFFLLKQVSKTNQEGVTEILSLPEGVILTPIIELYMTTYKDDFDLSFLFMSHTNEVNKLYNYSLFILYLIQGVTDLHLTEIKALDSFNGIEYHKAYRDLSMIEQIKQILEHKNYESIKDTVKIKDYQKLVDWINHLNPIYYQYGLDQYEYLPMEGISKVDMVSLEEKELLKKEEDLLQAERQHFYKIKSYLSSIFESQGPLK